VPACVRSWQQLPAVVGLACCSGQAPCGMSSSGRQAENDMAATILMPRQVHTGQSWGSKSGQICAVAAARVRSAELSHVCATCGTACACSWQQQPPGHLSISVPHCYVRHQKKSRRHGSRQQGRAARGATACGMAPRLLLCVWRWAAAQPHGSTARPGQAGQCLGPSARLRKAKHAGASARRAAPHTHQRSSIVHPSRSGLIGSAEHSRAAHHHGGTSTTPCASTRPVATRGQQAGHKPRSWPQHSIHGCAAP
jgi:hypothetical protein